MRRWIGILLSAALLIAAGAFLLWRSDLDALRTAAQDLPFSTIIAVFALLVGGGLLAGWRLKLISAELGIKLSIGETMALFSASTLVGALLFQFFGQALARSVWLSRRGHCRSLGVLMTLYEKGVATVVSLAMGVIGTWYLFGRLSFDMERGGAELVKIGLGVSFVIVVSAIVGWGWTVAPLLRRPVDRRFFIGLGNAVVLSLLIQMTTMAAFVLACRSLAPLVPQSDLIAATALVMLAASLPISFAGWGLREISAIFALGAVGVSVEKAFLVAVLIGVASQVALLAIAAGSFIRGKTVSSAAAASESIERSIPYDRAVAWAVPLCAAMAVYFQLHVPFRTGIVNVNLADPVAIIGAGLLLAVRFGNSAERPAWRLSFLEPHVLAASLVMVFALLHGILLVGPTEWAVTNKFLGWFVLLAYAATGSLIVTQGGRAGLVTILLTFAAAGAAVTAFDIALSMLGRIGIVDLGLTPDFRLSGFAQNPNAFGFQILLATICILVAGRATSAAVPILSILLLGVWLSASRAVLVALPLTIAAVWLMRARMRTLIFVAVPIAVVMAALIAAMPGVELVPTLNAGASSDVEHRDSVLDGLRMFVALPLFGSGLGIYVHSQIEQLGTFIIIHSTPIWLLAETGLIGFLAFAVPAVRTLVVEWKRRDSEELAGQLIVAALIAFAVTSLVHELLYQRAMWLLLGAGFAAAKTVQGSEVTVFAAAAESGFALTRHSM